MIKSEFIKIYTVYTQNMSDIKLKKYIIFHILIL